MRRASPGLQWRAMMSSGARTATQLHCPFGSTKRSAGMAALKAVCNAALDQIPISARY